MQAEAGPGPSSMASLPSTPGSANTSRTKKRIVNLVNPADPEEFSQQSMSPDSPSGMDQREREVTPVNASVSPTEVMSYTPLGVNKDGVRGILRPTGTPGSGNGVRFFPKNRFRVITPNQPHTPVPASPQSNSFLSQLLAATIPSMSPRPKSPAAPTSPNESWEVPGQEGEISLVASSVASERSIDMADMDEVEEKSWDGTPQVHSSPLGLPTDMPDMSAEGQELELPSRDINLPEDMSDLLDQKLSPSFDVDSFSVSEFSRIGKPPAHALASSSPRDLDDVQEEDESGFSLDDGRNDSNPTITRKLSPLPTRKSTSPLLARKSPSPPSPAPVRSEPTSPTPSSAPNTPAGSTKAFTSIFADMSAEQADLSWPLTRQPSASPSKSDIDAEDTVFHSVILGDLTTNTPGNRAQSSTPPSNAQLPKTPGNNTEWFDCLSPSPCPAPSAMVLSSSPMPVNPSIPAANLIEPARAMFDAHSDHANALISELQLYRKLASSLQAEVAERDSALADLNIRVIEGEVAQAKVNELEKEVQSLRSSDTISSRLARRSSQTPSPRKVPMTPPPESRSQHPGDRTTVAEASNRDLEIRLAKALADQDALVAQLSEIQESKDRQSTELAAARATVKRLEDRERDSVVQAQRGNEELRSQLEVVTRRERSLHSQLAELRGRDEDAVQYKQEAEVAAVKLSELESKVRKMEQFKASDEEELARLAEEVDRLHGEQEDTQTLRGRVEELEGHVRQVEDELHEAEEALEDEKHARQEALHDVRAERQEREALETELSELRITLETTKADLLARLETPSSQPSPEIAKLRAESASKDLEIITLQRRKAELKEDVEMLNIALDSKQQELELMKRKFAVRGVAGSTPLASSTRRANHVGATPAGSEIETPAPGRFAGPTTRRRSSMALVTPSLSKENGKMLTGGYGTDLWKSRNGQSMSKVDEENRPPPSTARRVSARRQSVMA